MPKKTTSDYNKMEKRAAKQDGAKLVKNSGRGHHKGDASFPDYLVDYKFNAKSFTLTLENWAEHSHNAWKEDHRSPLIVVNFNDRNKVAIIEWEQFVFLKTFYEENNNE